MATFSTHFSSQVVAGGWTRHTGSNSDMHLVIDEAISSADDSDYMISPAGTSAGGTIWFRLTLPSDFGSMDALNIQVRYRGSASGDDSFSFNATPRHDPTSSLFASTRTILPMSSEHPTSFTNTSVLAFSLLAAGAAATKAQWEETDFQLSFAYSTSMANDNRSLHVSAIELTGTYTTSGPAGATVQPAVIAATVALPAASISTSTPTTVTPAVTVATAALPASSRLLGASKTPAVIAAATAVPSASLQLGATKTPAITAAITALPQATPGASSPATVSPAVVGTVAALPSSTRLLGASQSPAVVAASVGMPASTRLLGASMTPAVVAALVAMPQAVAGAATVKTPSVVAASVSVPSSTRLLGATKTAGVIGALVAMPAATRQAGASRTPAVVASTVGLPSSTRLLGAGPTLNPVTVLAALPQANVSSGSGTFATPPVISVVAAVPSAARQTGSTKTPAAIALVAVTPQALVSLGVTRTPDAIPLVVAVPLVTLSTGEGPPAANPLTVAILSEATHTVVIGGVTYAVVAMPTEHTADVAPQTNTVTI